MDDPTPSKTHPVPPVPEPSLHGVHESAVGAMFAAAQPSDEGGWQPPTPEELQLSFAQYEIRGILGCGGMGAVYKGWHKRLERSVAIKILPRQIDDGGMNFPERFKQEAAAMARFRHPGVVAVYDAGETPDGLLYFTMELMEGTDVAKLVADHGRLPVAQALRITCRVCEALSYAHERGIIHRDIKPSNVMIEPDGTVKIADFGLAKFSGAEKHVTTGSGLSIGTPDFMPPEAIQGSRHVDHRGDIYALGGLLYQMLTGKAPHGRFEPPSMVVLGLDRRLDGIVDKAMQPEPEKRYASAAEMQADIARIDGISAAGPVRGLVRGVWANPLLATLLAAAFLGIAASGFTFWKNRRAGTPGSDSDPGKKSTAEQAAADELRHSWHPVPSKFDAPVDHGAVHLEHYNTWGAPRFRMANVAVRAAIAWQPPPGRNELIKVTARWTEKEHYYACLYGSVVEVGYYRAPGVTALQRWSVNPPPSPGEAVSLQLACVGHRIAVWVRDQLVGVIDDRIVNEAANVGVQAVDGHIQSLEYLDLDDLPEADAFQRLGLDASGSFAIGAGGTTSEAATKAAPFVNTLGMKFVPVPVTGGPTGGKQVLFSVWETRVQDYEVFAKETRRAWSKPKFEQGPTHPVVKVNWDDAQAFCAWLTMRERKAGRLGAAEMYRLPTDREWSCAVGIDDREDPAAGPARNSGQLADVFPWGTTWPPPPGAGNYSGEEVAGHEMAIDQKILTGYRDDFPETAPVGSFAGNPFGIFDLGGNAWEWCADLWKDGEPARVVRGGSFGSATRAGLFSSSRDFNPPEARSSSFGFRVVLDGTDKTAGTASPGTPKSTPATPATPQRGSTSAATASRWRDAFAEAPLKQIIAKAEHTPQGYRLPSGNHWRISPESRPSGAVRIRVTDQGEKFASLYIAHDDNKSERVRFLGRNNEWLLSTGTNGRDETTFAVKHTASPSDGHPHELLFARAGGRLRTTLDGQLLHDEADPSTVPGSFVLDIYSATSICVESVEYLDLDGIPESEALELLGIGKK